ncbi:DUF1129 domain-containing protein [Streptococcus merionis]|uniref:DUF1129 domain-containing protein n=1 Tax=Streptococcus merionis TaxID=400065 RepID=UPI0026F1EA74|nr:DUF1129 family protein [Streptococcus merionis]
MMEHTDLSQLTKKNQEYIHIATSQLLKNGKSDLEVKEALESILPTILENQKKGLTARQLFGAPTVWADSLTAKAEYEAANPPENDNPWLMWLDASLFILGIMGLMVGILGFSETRNQAYGFTSLILLSAATGGMMYAMYFYIYRHLGKPKSERPHGLKTWLTLALVMFGLFFIFSLSTLLPAVVNPIVPNWFNLLIGAAGFAARYFLKKRYNVKSAITSRS